MTWGGGIARGVGSRRTRSTVACVVGALSLLAAFSSAAGAADWQEARLPMADPSHSKLLGISCPTAGRCVAVGEGSAIATSGTPTGGASAWDMGAIDIGGETDATGTLIEEPGLGTREEIYAVSCPSDELCVGGTFDGYIVWSTNPAGGASTWRFADIDGPARDTHLMAISCPSASLCVAVSGERYTGGKILTSTDPTGGRAAWTVTQLDESLDLRGVSCGSPTFCVAVAESGRMIASTDPTGGPGAWHELPSPAPGNMKGIDCTGTAFCVAGNFSGNLLSSTDPLGGGPWSTRNGGGSALVTGISCLPTGQCAAVDNNGDVTATGNALDPNAGWSFQNLIPYREPASQVELPNNGLFSISCAGPEFCAAVGSGGSVFTSADPFAATAAPTTSTSTAGGKSEKGGRAATRPRTKLARVDHRHTKIRGKWARVRFRFHAVGAARGFECRLDRRHFRRCHSPKLYRRIGGGDHIFRVRAIGPTGLRGPVAKERVVVETTARGVAKGIDREV
jgi:hypothetical protein